LNYRKIQCVLDSTQGVIKGCENAVVKPGMEVQKYRNVGWKSMGAGVAVDADLYVYYFEEVHLC
jgi:hypothetical protein